MSDWNPTDPRSPLILQELHPEPSRAAVAAEECDQCGRIGKPFDLVASGGDAMPYLMPVQRFSGPEAYVRPLAPTNLLGTCSPRLAVCRNQYAPINRDPADPGSVLAGDGRSYTAGGPPDRVRRLGTPVAGAPPRGPSDPLAPVLCTARHLGGR